jgi:hypothetical protein
MLGYRYPVDALEQVQTTVDIDCYSAAVRVYQVFYKQIRKENLTWNLTRE